MAEHEPHSSSLPASTPPPMATPRLDGAGTAKMVTLDEASTHVQKLHGIVEHMAMAVRAQQSVAPYGQQLRRAGSPLIGLLKGQFGMIAEQLTAFVLLATRSGSDQMRVRALREQLAGVRAALEIASVKVIEKHALADDKPAPE